MGVFTKVTKGDPLSFRADTFNSFIDAAKAHKDGQNQIRGPLNLNQQSGSITVRNITGADQDQFAVLSLRDVVISPTDNDLEFKHNYAFDVDIFDEATDNPSSIVILQEPIKPGELGAAMISGTSPTPITVTNENDEYANLSDGATQFESSSGGVGRILYKEPGTGLKWGIVIFPVSELLIKMFKVVSVEADYLICHSWDGTTEGTTPITVALPYLLRRTPFDFLTRKNITYTYTTNIEREADNGDDTETQVIVASYEIGDIIYGSQGVLGGTGVIDTAGDSVSWLDLNIDGRYWAMKFETEEEVV